MANLLHKASIITTPTAYGVGVLNSIKPAIPFGEELITNDVYSVQDSNISYVANNGTITVTMVGGSRYVYKSFPTISGHSYRVNITGKLISAATGFQAKIRTGNNGSSIVDSAVATNGTISLDFVAIDSTSSIRLNSSVSGTPAIVEFSNISIKEKTDADFDFTRTSSAVRVAPDYLLETVSINGSELVQNGNFSELGSEIITNGNFETDSDWNLRSVWVISNGVCSLTPPNSDYLSQSNVFTANKFYKLSFDIVVNSGSLEPQFFDSGFQTIGTYSTTQSVVVYFESTSSGTLYFKPNSFDGSIDNVSVKQVDPNDYWTLGTGWSFGTNEAIVTNSTVSSIYQEILTINKLYKVSFTISNITSGSLKIGIGTSFSQEFTSEGTYTFTGRPTTSNLLQRITPSTGTNASITNVSAIEIQENGIPRLDYTNGTASILIEPQSTNLAKYSSNIQGGIDSGDYIKGSNTTLTYVSDVEAPDGTMGVYRLQLSAQSGTFLSFYTGNSKNTSLYVKAVNINNNNQFSLFKSGGSPSASSLFTASNNWEKFDFEYAQSSGNTGINNEGDAYASDLYIWGAQVEDANSYATSLINTSGSTVTRAAETLTNAGNSDLINSTEGVFYAEIKTLEPQPTAQYISINDGSGGANQVRIGWLNSKIYVQIRVNGSAFFTFNPSSPTHTKFNKIAVKFKESDYAIYINGQEVATNTSSNIFASDVLNTLSFSAYTSTGKFFGRCKTVAVFKEALSDTELACLTSTTDQEIFFNYYYRMQYVGADMSAIGCAERTYNI